MPRKKDEKREKAKQIFLDSDGMAKNPEIAAVLGVDSQKIAKWKCMDKWKKALENKPKKQGAQKGNQNARGHGAPRRNKNAQTHGAYSTVYFDELSEDEKNLIESVTLNTTENMLRELQTLIAKENDLKKPKKQGAQKGNQNARGHGAPRRNKNAQTHGAYSTVYFDELSEDEKNLIESVTLNTTENMLRELQTLIAKENDLKKRIAELNSNDTGELFVDRVVEMRTPKKAGDNDPYGTYTGDDTEGSSKPPLDVAMETTIKSSAFERAMKLEAELNKIHGRIIKLLDSIKSYELEQKRISLEERRYALMKQKASGVYEVDPDTGEIDDTYTEDEAGEGLEE